MHASIVSSCTYIFMYVYLLDFIRRSLYLILRVFDTVCVATIVPSLFSQT